MTDYSALLRAAEAAKHNAYAPYSRFPVGAALLTASGKIYTGVNVENASFPAGLCAERAAVAAAVAAGEREFSALAVVGNAPFCRPCGICRQVLAEFCPPDFPVIFADGGGGPVVRTISSLLPEPFGPADVDTSQDL